MCTDSRKLVLLQVNDNIIEEQVLLNDLPNQFDGLKISDDGVYIAVYEVKNILGLMFNLKTKKITFRFQVTLTAVTYN